MSGGRILYKNAAHNMGLGTKNRQKQTANICKQHLLEKYRGHRGLVEEFVLEFEGDRKNCDITRWDRFTDIKEAYPARHRRKSGAMPTRTRAPARKDPRLSALNESLNQIRQLSRNAADMQRDFLDLLYAEILTPLRS